MNINRRKKKVSNNLTRRKARVFKAAEFGERLREARQENRLTQDDLAEKLGVTISCISHYESGRRTPNVNMIVTLSEFLKVSLDNLILGD